MGKDFETQMLQRESESQHFQAWPKSFKRVERHMRTQMDLGQGDHAFHWEWSPNAFLETSMGVRATLRGDDLSAGA